MKQPAFNGSSLTNFNPQLSILCITGIPQLDGSPGFLHLASDAEKTSVTASVKRGKKGRKKAYIRSVM